MCHLGVNIKKIIHWCLSNPLSFIADVLSKHTICTHTPHWGLEHLINCMLIIRKMQKKWCLSNYYLQIPCQEFELSMNPKILAFVQSSHHRETPATNRTDIVCNMTHNRDGTYNSINLHDFIYLSYNINLIVTKFIEIHHMAKGRAKETELTE
jgi:hypothetical protein